MDRSLILAWILVLSAAMAPTCCRGYYSQSVPYVPTPQKVTHLHFFLQDILSGQDPFTVVVARPNMTTAFNDTLSPFGTVFVIDCPLTVGPELTSEVIGNARGVSASTGRDELSLTVYFDFGFTQGEFNGSSFSVFSRNPITQPERELAVVGGRGKFRMAKGFIDHRTYSQNLTSEVTILEYNVTLIHH